MLGAAKHLYNVLILKLGISIDSDELVLGEMLLINI